MRGIGADYAGPWRWRMEAGIALAFVVLEVDVGNLNKAAKMITKTRTKTLPETAAKR